MAKYFLILLLIGIVLYFVFEVTFVVEDHRLDENTNEYVVNQDDCLLHTLSLVLSPQELNTAKHLYLDCPQSYNEHVISIVSNSQSDFGVGVELRFSQDTTVPPSSIGVSTLEWESESILRVKHDPRLQMKTGEYGKYTVIFLPEQKE